MEQKDKDLKIGHVEEIKNELCPFCHKKTLVLRQEEIEIPYFGLVYLYSMDCSNCNYHKSDVEPAQSSGPIKLSFEVSSEDDLNVRVIKSAEATVKLPRILTISPGPASDGYITNIEGLLLRAKKAIETAKENTDDNTEKKKAKNLIKKIQRIIWGKDKITITIEDPSGNSAIVSEKTVLKKMSKK